MTNPTPSCICSNRAVQDYEGPLRKCPIHGEPTPEDDEKPMEAEVTIRFHIRELFSRNDLLESYESFDDAVKMLIQENGVLGLLEGGIPGPDAQILSVKEWRS